MTGSMSRNKGQRGEREVCHLLQPILDVTGTGWKLERNLTQTQSGGYDLVGVPGLAIEVKYHETITPNPWWEQCVRQAGDTLIPILIYRKSRVPWRVRMQGWLGLGVMGTIDVSIDDFMRFFKEYVDFESKRA